MAILIHELGHIGAACALGVRVIRVGLNWKGPYIVREPGTPAKCVAIAAVGPLANILTAFACLGMDWGWELCVISLVMAVVSLLPIPGSDGWRIGSAVRRVLTEAS